MNVYWRRKVPVVERLISVNVYNLGEITEIESEIMLLLLIMYTRLIPISTSFLLDAPA